MYALEFVSLSSFGQKLTPPPPPQAHPYPRVIFLKIESLHPWVRAKGSTKYEVDRLNTFWDLLLQETPAGV